MENVEMVKLSHGELAGTEVPKEKASGNSSVWYWHADEDIPDNVIIDISWCYNFLDDCVRLEYKGEYAPIGDCSQSDWDNRWYLDTDTVRVHGDIVWIGDDHIETCCSCGDDFHFDDINNSLCPSCYEEQEECEGAHHYGYTPTLTFYGEDENFHFWFEVEVEGVTDISDIDENFFYATEDSSLDSGCEVKNHPMTLSWIQNNSSLFMELESLLRENWGEIKDSCWLHIHVSRTAFADDAHLSKVYDFFNCYENGDIITSIAGRAANGYCKRDWEPLSVLKEKTKEEKTNWWVRYSAVNVLPLNTVEFRLFKATLGSKRRMARIEFVHAIIAWTKENDWSIKDFITFAKANERYPNLHWLFTQKDL